MPIYRPIERRPIPASQHLQYLVAREDPRRIREEYFKEQELAFGKIEQCTIDLPDLAFSGIQNANDECVLLLGARLGNDFFEVVTPQDTVNAQYDLPDMERLRDVASAPC